MPAVASLVADRLAVGRPNDDTVGGRGVTAPHHHPVRGRGVSAIDHHRRRVDGRRVTSLDHDGRMRGLHHDAATMSRPRVAPVHHHRGSVTALYDHAAAVRRRCVTGTHHHGAATVARAPRGSIVASVHVPPPTVLPDASRSSGIQDRARVVRLGESG